MDLKQCYQQMGGDYTSVIERLRTERLVQKFVVKFLDDPSCGQLRDAVSAQNAEEAFRAAHTLKGVSQNLSFTRLYESSNALSEALRYGWSPDAPELAARVYADYDATAAAIRAYRAAAGV